MARLNPGPASPCSRRGPRCGRVCRRRVDRDDATDAVPQETLAPATPPPPDHSAFVAAVDALAADALERGPIAGLSIAVFSPAASAVLAKGYGFADLEAKAPATAETSYPIASVSKHFTAALDPAARRPGPARRSTTRLSRFFPDGAAAIGALTLRHLLDHTSGLTRGGPAPRTAAQSVLRARRHRARAQGATGTTATTTSRCSAS